MGLNTKTMTFDNEFDLIDRELSEIQIKETYNKDKCLIWDRKNSEKSYNSFVLSKNNRSKTICELSFYKSSVTNKYLPRLIFKRVLIDGTTQFSKSEKNVNISFQKSDDAIQFWKLIGFLNSYKDIVDLGEFDKSFKIVSKDSFILEFKNKEEKQKIEDIKELISIAELSTYGIKAITFEARKQNLKAFYYLLKNKSIKGTESHTFYRERYKIQKGEEYIWHHFLKKHDWILGLNVDLKFIIEFLDEQKAGKEDSKGKGSPQIDLLGISEFTTLVELKHTNTNIFKKEKHKGRANTWDFTSDFIEGVSQCLGQKFELDKSFDEKTFIKENKTRLSKEGIQSIDPQSVLLIGNKKREFPINDNDDVNLVKNMTLQRFRRNNRNIDILTFDELFERAFHIVYSRKLDKDWYWKDEDEIFN